MPNAILDGLSLVDTIGHLLLAATFVTLLAAIGANLLARARYAVIERELQQSDGPAPVPFSHAVLRRVVRDVEAARRRTSDVDVQAIIEECFQAELKPLLLAERFVKAATGLVIILGLLGTFYGLTLSVGRLVHLVSADVSGTADIAQSMTGGLTQALMGMAVAFSNSLLGILSAVILTLVSVVSNVSDRRVALMTQLETYVDRALPPHAGARGDVNVERVVARFGESVAHLDAAVARFEAALESFASETRELHVQVTAVAPKARGGR